MATVGVTDDPARFDEAIRAFRKQVPMPEEQWNALSTAEREFAFKISGVAQADLVNDAWEAIDRAIREGTTLADFKADVGDALEQAWGGADPTRMETVFRTATQTAYNAGRYEILSHPDVRKARPYWRWDDVDDSREDDACSELHGVVLPADDPFWSTHQAPLHMNCRCEITPLTPEEADDEGISDAPPNVEADEGFGRAPTVGGDWEPDPSKYPSEIGQILKDRL